MSNTNDESRARESSNAVFTAHAPVDSMCALYTYNHAYYFMNGQLSPVWGGHGNMGTDTYYNNIMNLGYSKVVDEGNLTKDALKSRIRNDEFPPGSVICYKGNTPPPSGAKTSHYKYGHTQFYIGGSKTEGYSFPSSKKNNYGYAFVYDGRSCDSWRYLVFVPSGSSVMKYCEQEYVPTSNFPTGSGHEFYEPYNVEISDSQRNANGRRILSRLKGELGLSDTEASAFAGCFWVESKWNPTAYSRHPQQHDYGIAQWTTPYGRQQKLFEMCDNDKEQFRSLEKQIDFVVFELKNRYTSPTNGGTFSYNNLVPTLKKMSANGASLVELTWRVVCDYEAGGKFNGVSYSQAQYNSNANHIKERYEGAQKAMKLLGH